MSTKIKAGACAVPSSADHQIDDKRLYRLCWRIEELEISVRTYGYLLKIRDMDPDKLTYIGDLVQWEERDLLRTKKIGRSSLREIRELLEELGLAFGMKPDHELVVLFNEKRKSLQKRGD